MSSADLDDRIETGLNSLAQLNVDFEVADALAKLEKLNLVDNVENRYRAIPLEKAFGLLDDLWRKGPANPQ